MRILMLSKALVSGPYQKKCEELAAIPGVELTVLAPTSWREPRVGVMPLERRFTTGYRLEAIPIALNGQHHLHFYPTLERIVRRVQPEIFHVDEEAFNLATFLAMRAGAQIGARCCFYNYANIDRWYPPPFNLFERSVFRRAAHALAANREAEAIIRRHGYQGPLTVIPQFGVDPAIFRPADQLARQDADPGQITIGYVGRLVPEKGILDLLDAVARLPPQIQLRIIGDGVQRDAIVARAQQLGLGARVKIDAWSSSVVEALQQLDLLVLPSRTTRSWKEQFGRILVEAMSCGVPVIGSSSGEIPHVIGDAGLIFPERDSCALATCITQVAESASLRADLAARGRARVQSLYTQAALARRYHTIYESMRELPPSS